MITDSPTLAALRRAVVDHPEEDAPRLAYADELQAAATALPCPACHGLRHDPDVDWPASNGCERCGSTGVVGDGKAERAAFIRVQCELARCGVCNSREGPAWDWACGHKELRQRERELLTAHGPAWGSAVAGLFMGHVCRTCNTRRGQSGVLIRESSCPHCGRPTEPWSGAHLDIDGWFKADGYGWRFERGFIGHVRGPLAAFWGEGECPNCEGEGTNESPRYENTRVPCPDCGGEWEPRDEPGDPGYSPGTGRVSGPTAAFRGLAGAEPVQVVEVSDKNPAIHGPHALDTRRHPINRPFWVPGDSTQWDHWLPREVYEMLSSDNAMQPDLSLYAMGTRDVKYYANVVDATAALSRALLALARESP